MNVERNLPVIRERKLAILKGDPELCAQQKKAGKLLARERIAQLLDAASFVELDVLNADAGVVTGYGLVNGAGRPRHGRFWGRGACPQGCEGHGTGRKDRRSRDWHF